LRCRCEDDAVVPGDAKHRTRNDCCDRSPDMRSPSRGASRPSSAINNPPSEKSEGAGKTGCALHPRSRVHKCTKRRTRAYRFSGGNPAFPAQWFTAYSALSPVTGLSCHRRLARLHAKLDTSVGVSGPHDFAVRISTFRQARIHVHRIPFPTSVTTAKRPSCGNRMAGVLDLICPTGPAEYFSQRVWTEQQPSSVLICPPG
jgi:hypothetical protein